MNQDKHKAKKELEKIYNDKFKWEKAANSLKSNFVKSLKENPKLSVILKLLVVANLGIWLVFLMMISKFY